MHLPEPERPGRGQPLGLPAERAGPPGSRPDRGPRHSLPASVPDQVLRVRGVSPGRNRCSGEEQNLHHQRFDQRA